MIDKKLFEQCANALEAVSLSIRTELVGGPLCVPESCRLTEIEQLRIEDAMNAVEHAQEMVRRVTDPNAPAAKKAEKPKAPKTFEPSRTYMECSGRPIGRSGDT